MRIALGISYNGAQYNGWQCQTIDTTVQAQLEMALSKVADHPVRVICAGRTDKGVHAVGQVVHFNTQVERVQHAWVLGPNSYLPKDIRVQWARVVNDDFHARFSAIARNYRYVIYNHAIRSALLFAQTAWCYETLDEARMAEAANFLVGEHDFTSYRAQHCQAKSPVRTVQHLTVKRQGNFILLDIKANAFLHHMVRNIAGVLMAIGAGKQAPIWAKEVLEARNRIAADITASPAGLYFMQVDYPAEFNLPVNTAETFFLG